MKFIFTCIISFTVLFANAQSLEFRTNGRFILGGNKEKTASIGLGDIDNDGDIDIIAANGRHWPQQNRVFFNNGSGIYTVSQPLYHTSETSYSTEIADFDGDGDLDVAVGNDMAPNTILLKDGSGNFSIGGTFGVQYSPTRNLTVADIDQDGDADILITNRW